MGISNRTSLCKLEKCIMTKIYENFLLISGLLPSIYAKLVSYLPGHHIKKLRCLLSSDTYNNIFAVNVSEINLCSL